MKQGQSPAFAAVLICCCAVHGAKFCVLLARQASLLISVHFSAAQAGPPVLHQAGLEGLMRLQVSDAIGCTRLLTNEKCIGCAGLFCNLGLFATELSWHKTFWFMQLASLHGD